MRPLTSEGAAFLRSPRAQAALATLDPADPLAAVARLRREGFDPDEAGWLVDQAALRVRARGKLPEPERLLFTDEALEQASGLEVATWRAARLAGYPAALDLCAGIGGDALALARALPRVVAVELDPVRAALLEHNAAALGLADRLEVRVLDWTTQDWSGHPLAFVDPARRIDGRRVTSLHAMRPNLAAVQTLAREVPDVLVKVAPGLDVDEVPRAAGLELISVGGELKEALLVFGGVRRSEDPIATVLPGPHDFTGPRALPARVAPPGAYLLEPDPAVIRAGLVRALGERLDAWQLDPEVAYLSSDGRPETPFARAWRVLRHGPFRKKTLARWLRDLGPARVTVTGRATPIAPETLRRQLPSDPRGPERAVIVTRGSDGPLAIVGEPLR